MQVYYVMDCWLGVRVLNVHFMYKSKVTNQQDFKLISVVSLNLLESNQIH